MVCIIQYAVLFIAAAVFCFGYGGVPWAAAVAVLAHEAGHFTAARLLGFGIENIQLKAAGVRMDTVLRYLSFWRNVCFLLAGVVVNAAIALIWVAASLPYHQEIFNANMALCLINLLPAMPLDGGRLLYEVIVRRFGISAAKTTLRLCSVLIGAAILLLGGYVIYITGYNFTLALLGILVLAFGNHKDGLGYLAEAQLRQGRHYEKKPQCVRVYACADSMKAIDVAKRIPAAAVIAIIGKDGTISGLVTPSQVCGGVIDKGYDTALYELLKE